MSETRTPVARPEGTTAIGFKTEDWTEAGDEMGPVFWIHNGNLTPVIEVMYDDSDEPSPDWLTRRETIRQAKKMGLKVQEV